MHDEDGYPVNLPPEPRTFLETPGLLAAWVADDDADGVVGHVVLRERTQRPVMAAAARATGLDEGRLAVVGRLLVAPAARRRGIGGALLEAAAAEARARGRRPILDVVDGHAAAIALYDRCGWERAGEVAVTFGTGRRVHELVYLGPSA